MHLLMQHYVQTAPYLLSTLSQALGEEGGGGGVEGDITRPLQLAAGRDGRVAAWDFTVLLLWSQTLSRWPSKNETNRQTLR